MSVLDGPLAFAVGPGDHEGLGRERYWDMTPAQRTAALKEMVVQADAGCLQADTKAFARGWLAEHERDRRRR